MSKPKVLYKKCWFLAEDAGALRDTAPVFSDAQLIGTVLTMSGAREYEEAIFETPVAGKWVDMDVVNQRDRTILTVTCNELTPLFFELVEAMTGPYDNSEQGQLGDPGKTVTRKGWFRYEASDDAGIVQHAAERWCSLSMPGWDYPQVGYVQATFTLRVLYSSLAYGAFKPF